MANDQQTPRWKRFLAHLQDTELRLWHMVVGVIFTTLVTTCVPLVVDQQSKQADRLVERSLALSEVASDFENSVNRLVHSASTIEAFSPEALASLLLNVEQQIRALNQLQPSLVGEKRQLSVEYARRLVLIRNTLQDGLSAEDTRTFGIAAQELVSLRNRLLADIS